jgi:signal transduction histidine kinase
MNDTQLSGSPGHARANILARYRILDSARETGFDELAALASDICETPIAVVNLISDDRQWFKAEVGLGVRSTPLQTSFCATAILEQDYMEVPDATRDPRFSCNPLVTENGLRFYAGALLKSAEGIAFGSLCVLDYRPRLLTDLQQRALKTLARQVVAQLELRLALFEREEINARLRASEAAEARAQLIADRERIARELHDTLLQSVQTLIWRCQLAVDGLAPEEPTRRSLEGAMDQAEQVIAEGRSRVMDLRSVQHQADVATLLADLVTRQAFDPGVAVSISTLGSSQPVTAAVAYEVYRIAGEAIFNIWRHSSASRVAIEVAFGPDLEVRFCDDGVGIDRDIAVSGISEHFGLLGMRERAATLGGELTIQRRPNGGTEVALKIPAAIAFDGRSDAVPK